MGDVAEERVSTKVSQMDLNQAALGYDQLHGSTFSHDTCVARDQGYASQFYATSRGLYRRYATICTLSLLFPLSQPRQDAEELTTSVPEEDPPSFYVLLPLSSFVTKKMTTRKPF